MEDDVLVLQLATFPSAVSATLRQAIVEATAERAPVAVVLDLRGNPGGLLHEAVRVADAFLREGEIVSTRGRTAGSQRTWHADAEELLPGLPMAVLIDRRSASASELVAAALQDHGRAAVLGQRSFGKGTVQTTFTLGEEAKGALKLTSSYYHRPAGPTVQKTGVAPDVELVAAPAQAADAAAPSQARVDPGRCAAIHKAADPVLACAVAYLRSGNVEGFLARLAP
jgi:carboxyl-terminal processing protease